MNASGVAPALVPMPFTRLLAWALAGLARERTVFGLPRRSIWTGSAGLDLSVPVPGGRAATPLGVAAGPHTQLAHNLVVAWLAGARVLELKTVQVLDQLELPRPCIDAPAEGYNVEWSQELPLAQSLEQYVSAWALIHVLAPRVLGEQATGALAGTRFDASVGYDLAGIRSDGVARFLDLLTDATPMLARLRDALPASLGPVWPASLPTRVIDTVTLSSFHGCPAHEIGDIVEHLFARHRLHVVVKLNPTLLGHDEVDALLHGSLGWHHVELDRAAFERDLQWEGALALIERATAAAARHGCSFGVKLTNTLVVRNTRGRLAGDAVYLSGAPLHPIATRLAERLVRATGGALPMALSAGACAENFADTVACGFAPVTTCTDLLRPTGYRRLPRYLKALEAELVRTGCRDIAAYVAARAHEHGREGSAALANLSAHAAQARQEARYAAPAAAVVAASRPPLALIDCESCNQCALACPNGAFFDVASPAAVACAPVPACERQWIVFADFCNSCGNCDTFCPQDGGPYRVKARFHSSRAVWSADPNPHAALLEPGGQRLTVRDGGHEYSLVSSAAPDGGPAFQHHERALAPEPPVRVTEDVVPAAVRSLLLTLHALAEQAHSEVTAIAALR
ncbi:MAG: glutamate synthase [Candidatus Eisenbacteria bacterium]